MKKILIIGAGTEQISVIQKAKELGHFVIVTDFNPKAPGIKYADKFYLASTTDGPENVKVGKQENIDAVLTVCSETAVPTVAYVAEHLGLPGYSSKTAVIGTNKEEMRKALLSHGVNVSQFLIVNDGLDYNEYVAKNEGPWVVKPVDSSGQRGTNLVHDANELAPAIQEAIANSSSKKALLDQFIEGPEIHVTMHVINGTVHFLAITDRITLDHQNFGIAIRHLGPSDLDSTTLQSIKNECSKGVQALEVTNGIVTCELILKNNRPYVMEVAIRVPGGYLREVASLLSGVDVDKTTIWSSLGQNKPFQEIITEKSYPAVSVQFISVANLHPDIRFIKNVPSYKHLLDSPHVQLINFHFNKDFEVPALNSSVARFGAIITTGETPEAALKNTENVFNALKIEGQPLSEYTNYNPNNKSFN